MSCSHSNCACGAAGHPPLGTPEYILQRAHDDAGDLDALRLMCRWLSAETAFCHLRFADGEFNAILGHRGLNGDGAEVSAPGLGQALESVLLDAMRQSDPLLIGVDWTGDPARRKYLERHGMLRDIQWWCPSQVFVNGIMSGDSLNLLELIREARGQVHLVANGRVCDAVAPGLNARPYRMSSTNAWGGYKDALIHLRKIVARGDIVLYAVGMTSEPLAYRMWKDCLGSTHIDVGCFFDAAIQARSRSWLHPDDERYQRFQEVYVPWLKGK